MKLAMSTVNYLYDCHVLRDAAADADAAAAAR